MEVIFIGRTKSMMSDLQLPQQCCSSVFCCSSGLRCHVTRLVVHDVLKALCSFQTMGTANLVTQCLTPEDLDSQKVRRQHTREWPHGFPFDAFLWASSQEKQNLTKEKPKLLS